MTGSSLPGYPLTLVGRRHMRADIRRRILLEAERKIQEAGRSLNCGPDRPGHGRCLPENCLCECHDPEPQLWPKS